MRLLIAASGTGGHLFPAIATAAELSDHHIEWLGVPDRLETQLVPQSYPLHTIAVGGFQTKLGLGSVRTLNRLTSSVFNVRRLLRQEKFDAIFTTGGYIAGPAILAARSLGVPVILHESNVLPGKVTRLLSRWCDVVALGFEATKSYIPVPNKTVVVGTPVRPDFLEPSQNVPFDIPEDAFVIVVVGGSQGAVAVNQLVRQAAPDWFKAGIWVVHLTGTHDPDINSLQHSQYIALPFYDRMAALLNRANLAISRAGSGTLTELAVTQTPAILIPYPYAAEDHQTHNANVFTEAGAALMMPQKTLTSEALNKTVFELFKNPEKLAAMKQATASLAVRDSAKQLADLIIKRLG
jgi:UDP-N-acetylglucosamine--N-acetylmuramyl-(pentapeptide) pyrophosphoryl-undecaprenol N-acetylglucosamine transferase